MGSTEVQTTGQPPQPVLAMAGGRRSTFTGPLRSLASRGAALTLDDGSRNNRGVHVPFWGGRGVGFPPATRSPNPRRRCRARAFDFAVDVDLGVDVDFPCASFGFHGGFPRADATRTRDRAPGPCVLVASFVAGSRFELVRYHPNLVAFSLAG